MTASGSRFLQLNNLEGAGPWPWAPCSAASNLSFLTCDLEVLQIFFLPRADWGDVKGARTWYSRTQKASAELLSTCPPWSCGGSHSGSLPAPLVSPLPPRFCLPLPHPIPAPHPHLCRDSGAGCDPLLRARARLSVDVVCTLLATLALLRRDLWSPHSLLSSPAPNLLFSVPGSLPISEHPAAPKLPSRTLSLHPPPLPADSAVAPVVWPEAGAGKMGHQAQYAPSSLLRVAGEGPTRVQNLAIAHSFWNR